MMRASGTRLIRIQQARILRRILSRRQLSSSAKPCEEVTVQQQQSTTDLVQPFFDRQEPLVLRHLLETTPQNQRALQEFVNWEYWKDLIGEDADCHVELGGNYSQSQIADIPFMEFLQYLQFFEERFGRSPDDNNTDEDSSSQNLIYLAQNDVFPRLLEQIDIPTFCESVGEGKLYSTMLWIGPYGCLSPLHFDPLDNCLMQFVGRKRVFLCAPTSQVQAGSGGNQKNTSPLDPEQVIASGSSDVAFQGTTLNPGDALYIPKKWYHHVRTVETSVSVNTWFR